MDYKSFSQQEIKDGALEVVSRQAQRSGKGFIAVKTLEVINSLLHESCVEISYKAVFTLVSDAAVWTENSAGIHYIANLLHFEVLPTAETLKSKGISQSRVYQLWKAGTEFTAEGKFWLVKTAEGWFAPRNSWYDNTTEEDILNASIPSCPPLDKYLLVSLQNGEPVLTVSPNPWVSLPAPVEADVKAAVEAYLAEDGLQRLVSFRIIKQNTDPENISGTYRYSEIEAEVEIAFLKPDGKAHIFDADISYRKTSADTVWETPSIRLTAR
ncbi:MAG: hypothetical protein LBV39_05395 [Bacteroidales bacterium]|jgi:hypothetical protein|nr:hypothetical protein [Bacteroidales bacterium]